jgi:hypothetical protein
MQQIPSDESSGLNFDCDGHANNMVARTAIETATNLVQRLPAELFGRAWPMPHFKIFPGPLHWLRQKSPSFLWQAKAAPEG